MPDTGTLLVAFLRRCGAVAWIKDEDGRYAFATPAMESALRQAPDSILGKTYFDVASKEVATRSSEQDREVLRTGQAREDIEEGRDPSGQPWTWFISRFLLPFEEKRYVAGLGVNITAFKQEKREVEGMFRQVLNAITDMVLVKGPGSKLEWANDAFLEAYGMDNEQLRGIMDAPFVEPDYTQKYVRDDQRVFDTGRPLDIVDEPMTRHDGKVLSCHTVKSPIFNSEGKVIKTVGVIRDISERKRLELELRQSQRLESVGRMASGIAHEINTPIQFVSDQTQFLHSSFEDLLELCQSYAAFVTKAEREPVTAADVAAIREAEERADLEFVGAKGPSAFEAILDGTARVAKLVQAMKEFGHPDSAHAASADINHALETTLVIAANELKYVADVETDFGELPAVRCQIGGLNQVFLNILVNAAHAIGDVVGVGGTRGLIKVKTHRVGDDVVISISDTGRGIPEAIRGRVFDPFFTTKEVGRGTGQGLAIARLVIVEKHAGTLSFETEDNCGTTFHIKIPIAGAPATGAAGLDP